MKNHTQEAITAYSEQAITALRNLGKVIFEASIELNPESKEFNLVCADIQRVEKIIKQVQDLDVNANPFGLSNFPFCNKK